MRFALMTHRANMLMMCFMIVSLSACTTTQITQVTQVIPVTQVVQVTQVVDVTHIIPVTRIVHIQIVDTPPTAPGPVPAPTEAPIPSYPPMPTQAPPEGPEPTQVPEPTKAPPPTVVPFPTPPPPPAPTAAPIPTYPPAPTASNDVLVWYDFEGNFLTTGIIADRSGNGFDSQVNGLVDVTDGISGGQAILFSGNGFIHAQSNPVAGRNIVSFSMWFRTDHPETDYTLASAAWRIGDVASGWVLATHLPEFWSDDHKSLYLPDITNQENYFPASEWVNEVVTYNGSRIKEYTNGQLVNNWPATGVVIGQGLQMVIGAWPSFPEYNFQGSIDEFRIFGWALSPEEIQAIYNERY